MRDRRPSDPKSHALSALAWVLGDDGRANRLLGTTGLTPELLRSGLGRSDVLAAILAFLEAHEPDLLECAEATGIPPGDFVAARQVLSGEQF
jgi:hypothetical protein